MKKSEKILLQICVCLLLIAMIWILFLKPSLLKKSTLDELSESAQLQMIEMQNLLKDPSLETELDSQKKLSDENYQFFYSVLNSYTIDEILNQLAKDNSLFVQGLQIGDYVDASSEIVLPSQEKQSSEGETDASEDTAETSDTSAEQSVAEKNVPKLLKSQVTISVLGTYENILSFVDAMNTKSISLKIDSISLNPNQRDATGKADQSASIGISIYGITKPSAAEEETELSTEN